MATTTREQRPLHQSTHLPPATTCAKGHEEKEKKKRETSAARSPILPALRGDRCPLRRPSQPPIKRAEPPSSPSLLDDTFPNRSGFGRHGEGPRRLLLRQRRRLQLWILWLRIELELLDTEHGQHWIKVWKADHERRRLILRSRREPVHANQRSELHAVLPLKVFLGFLQKEDTIALPQVQWPYR
ncbi:hypothetical protein ACQJBY_007627 [Aegilops geniculata]